MKPAAFPCNGSVAEARARLEAAIDGRPWNSAGLDGWIRGDRVVLYYRDAAKYRALFRPTFIGRFRERDGKTVLDGRVDRLRDCSHVAGPAPPLERETTEGHESEQPAQQGEGDPEAR
jgi:hypothetical protein